jgi:outer membrane protein
MDREVEVSLAMTSKHTKKRMAMAVSAAAMVAAATSVARAQQLPSEARIRELVRLAAQQIAGGQATPVPQGTVAQPILQDDRPVVQLTLDDAVKLALERNLTIAVQRLNPESFDPAIAALRATYWPTLTSLVSAASVENPATSSIVGVPSGANGVTAGTTTYNAGLVQNAPWGGGTLNVSLNNIRTTSTSTTVLFNPTYNPTYTAQYTQPLLRGFSIDPNRQQILVTKLNRDVTDIQLKSTIVNTLSSVREAYWNYLYGVQAVDVARQTVDSAAQLVRDNQVRLDVGTIAELDLVTAQSQQAQAQQALVQAVASRRTLEIALKQLIVRGTQDPNWSARIDPTDRPDFEPVTIDVEAAVRRALSERTDLAQARKSLEANDVTYRFLRNQLLPQANLVASYGLSGLGGTKFVRESSAISSPIVSTVPGGFTDALGSLLTNTYPSWNVGLNVSVPIGLSVATASMAGARIEREQTASQVRQIELQIAVDVTNAATNVQSTVEAVQAARAAQELAQKTYEGEQAKFDVGLSTNYNVILDLNALNTVKNSYLQAVLNYRNALVELDRLQQTTLSALGVTLLSQPSWTAGSPASGNLLGVNSGVGSAR